MADLERELVSLVLDAPSVDLRAGVARAIAAEPARRRRRRVVLVAALVALLGVGGVAAPVVARWLGVGAVEVRLGNPPGTVAPRRVDYGRRVTLGEARRDAGFAVAVPAALGEPEAVWLDRIGRATVVWFVYPDALVAQTDAVVADQMLATKFASGAQIERIPELDGLWIEGAHVIALRDGRGDVVVDGLRISDSVLLWERDGVTFRIETTRGRAEALRIARSF